jgi:hypothetical protein
VARNKTIALAVVVIIVVVAVTGAVMAFNKSPDLLNSEFCIIVTDSMAGEPTDYEISTIPVNSLIAVHKMSGVSAQDISIGDVVGYKSVSVGWNTVYHRVVSIDVMSKMLTVKGDNVPVTEIVSFDEVTGKVANVSYEAGVAVVLIKEHIFLIVLILIIVTALIEVVPYLFKRKEG